MEAHFVGVDVGTGSVRAGVFDTAGRCLASAASPITLHRPRQEWAEQSSEEIWQATTKSVRRVLADSGVSPSSVRGVGFDATCSLVLLAAGGRPLSVDPEGAPDRNVIVWMDHRATDQAVRLSRTGAEALRYVGGTLSPEMEVPKLAWLRESLPGTFDSIWKAQDLADHLVWRATGEDVRSVCTLGCKWGYLAHEGDFDRALYREAGIASILEGGRAGDRVGMLGESAGGLAVAAAGDLGLVPGTAVAVGIIDAHAGGLGTLDSSLALDEQMALVAGTSACHMAVSTEPCFVPGVWGPYWGAMVPGMWLSEGGQSAAGALLDHVVRTHARSADLGPDPHGALGEAARALVAREGADAVRDLHVLPYFHGNRSPRADPLARGAIHGLTLDDSLDSLARLYLAAVQALAYGTRHIVATMNAHGHRIGTVHLCGGSAKNPLYVQEHADALGLPVRVVREPDAMLLGTAILAAVASGEKGSIRETMALLGARGETTPSRVEWRRLHEERYEVFLALYEDQRRYRDMVSRGATAPGKEPREPASG